MGRPTTVEVCIEIRMRASQELCTIKKLCYRASVI